MVVVRPYLRGTSHVSGKRAFAKQQTGKGSMKSRVLSRGLILRRYGVSLNNYLGGPSKEKTIHIQQPLQVGDTTSLLEITP